MGVDLLLKAKIHGQNPLIQRQQQQLQQQQQQQQQQRRRQRQPTATTTADINYNNNNNNNSRQQQPTTTFLFLFHVLSIMAINWSDFSLPLAFTTLLFMLTTFLPIRIFSI